MNIVIKEDDISVILNYRLIPAGIRESWEGHGLYPSHIRKGVVD